MIKNLLKGFAAFVLMVAPAVTATAAPVDSEGMPILYLLGDFTDNKWQPDNRYKFTRSGAEYTLAINNSNRLGNCQFKIGNDDWTYNLGASSEGVSVDKSQYIVGQFDGKNFSTNGLGDCVISFTYLPDNKSTDIKFVINGIEPSADDPSAEKSPVYLRGDFNNTAWAINEAYRFVKSGDVYTLTITSSNPITAGSSFKIGDEKWAEFDFGTNDNLYIDTSQTVSLERAADNLKTNVDITSGSISFSYPESGQQRLTVKFDVNGEPEIERPVQGLSGTLPVLYINVYADEAHSAYNNEILSKDLSHKNYFEFSDYWLDTNGCEWLEALGAENVGSKEKPLALQIKARGNWTRVGFSKKPFKIKLDKKQSLLGLTKSKHFALLAHADDDKAYLRNFTGFNLGKRIGLPWTPTHQPVELVINGDYRGLYFLTESIRVDEDRVNIVELNDNETAGKLISGGYIVELDNYDEDDSAQIRMEEKSCVSGQHLDMLRITFDTPEVYSDLQRRFIKEQFTAMNDYVGSNNDKLWSYIDLDDAARYYLVEEIISHTESYHGSTYLFRDFGEGQKWHFSPLWDFGNAFNGSTSDFFYNCDPFGNTWIPSMRQNDKFNQKVRETWLWFMSNKYDGLEADMDQYVARLTAAAKADYDRWNAQPVPAGGQTVANNRDMQPKLNDAKDILRRKIEWLKSKFGNYTSGTYAEPARDTTAAAALPEYAKPDDTVGADVIPTEVFDPADAEFFNLQGMKVASPVRGEVYIRVRGDKADKVVIR